MPDLRKDPIVGRWVIIATSRQTAARFRLDAAAAARPLLPVLRRAEDKTPDEIIAYRRPARSATAKAGASASCPTSFPRWRSKAN